MTIPAQKLREVILQLLFSQEFLTQDLPAELLRKELKLSLMSTEQAKERALTILSHKSSIDSKLLECCPGYTLKEIHPVERNILRLGAYEILFDEAIPPKVAISEAIRLSSKFSSKSSISFVNAVLDALWKSKEGESLDREALRKNFDSYLEPHDHSE